MTNRFGDWDESNTKGSPCINCHWIQPGAVWAAFPTGIPGEILNGDNDHRQPYPGDHGIQYSPNESERRYIESIAEDSAEE